MSSTSSPSSTRSSSRWIRWRVSSIARRSACDWPMSTVGLLGDRPIRASDHIRDARRGLDVLGQALASCDGRGAGRPPRGASRAPRSPAREPSTRARTSRRELVVAVGRADPVGVEDHLVAVGGERLGALGRSQLALGQLDRAVVYLLGVPERAIAAAISSCSSRSSSRSGCAATSMAVSFAFRVRHGNSMDSSPLARPANGLGQPPLVPYHRLDGHRARTRPTRGSGAGRAPAREHREGRQGAARRGARRDRRAAGARATC